MGTYDLKYLYGRLSAVQLDFKIEIDEQTKLDISNEANIFQLSAEK